MNALRLFFGVPLPAATRAALAALGAELRGTKPAHVPIRLVAAANLHVTLKFLGSSAPSQLGALEALLDAAADGLGPIESEVLALTGFGSERRARVLVVRLSDGQGRLAALAARLDKAAEPLGFSSEARAFTAHVTLGRLARPSDLRSWLATASPLSLRVRLDRFCLYRSELAPGGSRYHVLGERAL